MSHNRYKRLFLFLVVLVFPSVVIGALGWTIVTQQRGLAEKRVADAQRRTAREIGQDLLARLERIKLQEITAFPAVPGSYSNPAVMLVGLADRERLVLPWDADANADHFRRSIAAPEFAFKIEEAEHAEFAEKRFDHAAALYRESIQTAHDDGQRAYARLLLARTLVRSGAHAEAFHIYRDLLNLPSNIVDEHGLSFASYAAGRLVDAHAADRDVLERVKKDLESPAVLTPTEIYRLKDILEKLRNSSDAAVRLDTEKAIERLSTQVKRVEQALALQENFPKLRMTSADWQPYGLSGDDVWLIGMTPARAESKPLVIAVGAASILKSVKSDRPSSGSWQMTMDATGEPLSKNLPSLGINFQSAGDLEAASGLGLARWFYTLSLLLVVSLTFLGGYLLWRDTQREVRVAELRSQFVSSVSHELKTPLTAIRMFAEMLQMIGSTDPKTRDEYLETIVNESERLTRLLNNVLDFSRIEHGQKSYRMESTQLPEVVSAAARTMQYPLAEQGFDLRVNIDNGIPPVDIDRDAMKQAILNLLTNAMKYSGKRRDIELRLCPQNGDALIQVSDHGIGIPADEQARIFEKFYRARVPENRAIAGTGLGLALVAHIAEAHGGSVHVESTLGEGSTFSIRLPLHAGSNS